jgi:hypothetical protein
LSKPSARGWSIDPRQVEAGCAFHGTGKPSDGKGVKTEGVRGAGGKILFKSVLAPRTKR